MKKEEYKAKYNTEDAAPGWDAIDNVLKKLYKDQEPKHWAANPHYSVGGDDPIDGISYYEVYHEGELYYHFVTYGFSNLYYDEKYVEDDYSGYGFELTFRLKPFELDEKGPQWVYSLIQNIARYVFSSGQWFEPNHYMSANGPIRLNCDTELTGLAFSIDPELGEIETVHGKLQFIQLFGITDEEFASIKESNSNAEELLKQHSISNPFLITDLERNSLNMNEKTVSKCESCEVSESGAPIFTYTDGEKEWQSAQGEECIEEISDHIEKHIGKVHMVFHELVSDTVHVDVHHVLPSEDFPFHTLVTSGMSDLEMNVPSEYPAAKHMELVMMLPEHWQLDKESFDDENWYWPIRQLKYLARFPHKYDTWLGFSHTIPNGDPAVPFADKTKLNGILVVQAISLPEEFDRLKIDENKTIEFHCLMPLYDEEMSYKLEKGCDALLDKFKKYKINDVIDINRRNVMKKRFGLF